MGSSEVEAASAGSNRIWGLEGSNRWRWSEMTAENVTSPSWGKKNKKTLWPIGTGLSNRKQANSVSLFILLLLSLSAHQEKASSASYFVTLTRLNHTTSYLFMSHNG